MSKEALYELFNKAIDSLIHDGLLVDKICDPTIMSHIYFRMFGFYPHTISTNHNSNDIEVIETDNGFIVEDGEPEETPINGKSTIENIIKNNECLVIKDYDNLLVIFDSLIISYNYDEIYGCYHDIEFPEFIQNYYVFKDKQKKRMRYVTHSSRGFNITLMEVDKQECDIETNYNDDLPHNRIVEILESPESGIIILHGKPGCGKTSYIRYLIYNTDKNFMFLDSSVFECITDASFINLLVTNKDSIIVLEDCETLLRDRASGNNKLAALLNLSDGILGDSLHLKFLCTFNSDLSKIDPAILRKGRLKMKYEFGLLATNKAINLANKLGFENNSITKPISLCDIYNLNIKTGGEIERSRVGFTK